jgi:hypothetical protein
MALFAVNTGCRDTEICGLRWDWEIEVAELGVSVFIIPGALVKNGDERLVVLNDAVPQPHARIIHDAAASTDKTFRVIKGATHYYQGQPELLKQAVELCVGWMGKQNLLD